LFVSCSFNDLIVTDIVLLIIYTLFFNFSANLMGISDDTYANL